MRSGGKPGRGVADSRRRNRCASSDVNPVQPEARRAGVYPGCCIRVSGAHGRVGTLTLEPEDGVIPERTGAIKSFG